MDEAGLSSQEQFERTNAARDAAAGVGIVDDPFPRYHELRAQCPVHEGTLTEKFGFAGLDGALFPGRRHVVALGYERIEAILKEPEVTASFAEQGFYPMPIPFAQLKPFVANEVRVWRRIVALSGATAE